MFPFLRLNKTPVTTVFLAIIIGLYLLGSFPNYTDSQPWVWGIFGLWPERLIAHHEWWRLFSWHFFHANVGHILHNAFGLLIFGLLLELEIGSAMLLAICMVGATGSNIASVVNHVPNTIGASGILYGMEGFYVAMYIKRAFVEGTSTDASNAIKTGLVLVAVDLYYNFSAMGGVNIYAHYGGAWACIALAMMVSPRLPYTKIDWGTALSIYCLGNGFLIYRILHSVS
jgi:membrane associated rhomboid family serine protease